MSDNRTTELLCKLLEERGEEYVCNDFGITWSYYDNPHTATESMDGTLIVTGLTPEQAIAATLGSGNCARCAEDMGRYADSLCDPLKECIAELLRCLEKDWNIRASWDGLRKFWCIELTDEGVKLRDATHGTLTAEQVREAIERNFGKVAVLDDGKPVEWRDDWVCKIGINYKAIADELNARAERTCRIVEYDEAPYPVCSECGAEQPDDYTVYYCWSCGAKVVGE